MSFSWRLNNMAKIKIMIQADEEDVEYFKELQKDFKEKGYSQQVLFKQIIECFKKEQK
jgi:uridine kinase